METIEQSTTLKRLAWFLAITVFVWVMLNGISELLGAIAGLLVAMSK